MSDAKQTLSPREIEAAGLGDWRQVLGTLRARFKTGDFATGLALVDGIGAVAEEANHHPDIRLSYGEVIVDLTSHDVGGLTSRDVDLARRISELAGEAGAEANPGGLTQLEIGLDTARSGEHAPFYAALLGGEVRHGEPVDPSGQVPTIWWQEPHEDGPALPAQDFEQRWHFDVWVPIDEGQRRVDAAIAAGGRLISDESAPSYWVLEDSEGNRSCVCTVANRGWGGEERDA